MVLPLGVRVKKMETLDKFKETKEDIVETPKDIVLEGVIVGIKKGTLQEHFDEIERPDIAAKFTKGLDDTYIFVEYETAHNGLNIKGSDRFKHYSPPMDNSNYGKFLMKYSNVGIGGKIKIMFNGEGFSKVILD